MKIQRFAALFVKVAMIMMMINSTKQASCGDVCNIVPNYCNDCCPSCTTINPYYICDSTSTPYVCVDVCADGHVMRRFPDEYCDDDNTNVGDGCNDQCITEPGWTCQGGDESNPDICTDICGDGLVMKRPSVNPEYCDDGNKVDGDGCNKFCQTESGFTCYGGSKLNKDVCEPICGDNIYMKGHEECEDANLQPDDGCSPDCTIDIGYKCNTTTGTDCFPVCGDGIRVTAEQCDDGNTLDEDGCSSQCIVEPQYSCGGGSLTTKDVCIITCGDGILSVGDNQCDDGNVDDGDGCSNECQIEAGFKCQGQPSNCIDICGDGKKFFNNCDDGNKINGDGCSSTCQVEAGYSCTGGGKNK